MFLALAFTAMGCSDDITTGGQPANAGDEVQFGVALSGVTRTVYGDETDTGFPIYWVNGDKVKVASPQCNVRQAEYLVAVNSETQNYATSLTKTGDAGVQWGSSETADFYSIYPSGGATLNVSGNTVTASLAVASTQYAATTEKQDCFYAQPADMGNVVMYAKTSDVQKSSNVVDLRYKPFSTVIEFEIKAPKNNSAGELSEITIQSLTLTAPTDTYISGNFTFNFPENDDADPTISNTSGSNVITMHFLENNQYTTKLSTTKNILKAKMCLMPVNGVTSLKGWQVSIGTSAGTFSMQLNKDTGELKPGMVHKLQLPQLSYSSTEWTYSLDNWITSLPDYKNIYLTEVSLPGAWYAGSTEDYQATSDISKLWNAGVRAFAVECRTFSNLSWSGYVPSGVVISGSGRNQSNAYTNPLGGTAVHISSIVKDIASAIKSDEYGVLVLSYADGGSGGHRESDHNYFIAGVANEITQSGATNIYASEITPNTTINDVLGKLIVKINVDDDITKSSYSDNMNALLSYVPFTKGNSSVSFSKLYWMSWDNTYKQNVSLSNSEFLWCYNSANRTQVDSGTDTTVPTYAQRQGGLQSMMNYSKQIYDASSHNVWFYFNAGGTEATSSSSEAVSPTSFASTMNPWLLSTINDKADASPLGIVMFNQCTGSNNTYHGADIIKAIIEMNSKFYLKHAGDNTDGSDTPQVSTVKSVAPGYSSGMLDDNTDAIGWTRSN